MRRVIQPEILDELPADDPRAIQSRRDLQKVNTFMGHPAMVARELGAASTPPRVVVELGAGDGTFLLRVAKRLRHRPRVRALLVDRRPSLSDATRNGFAAAGWDVEICESDVFEWLSRPSPQTADVTVANLFLHHFREGELARSVDALHPGRQPVSSRASHAARASREGARLCCAWSAATR